jgi:hypothetical protein
MRVRFPLPAPFMNVCHEHKTILWLPQKTASRTICKQFQHYNFLNYTGTPPYPIKDTQYSHVLTVPEGCENYEIICAVRNPFSWVLSIWHYEYYYPEKMDVYLDIKPFSDYLESERSLLEEIYDYIKDVDIKYVIKYENLKEDLSKIPWFEFDKNQDFVFTQNFYQSDYLFRDKKNKLSSNYKLYYTEKCIKNVQRKYSDLFKRFNYSLNIV